MSPKTVAHDMTPRLKAVAQAIRDDESLLRDDRELRRRLVLQALDEGMSYRAIADALGGGTGLVSKIVAKPEPEEESQ